MIKVKVQRPKLRTLDLDIETRLVGFYQAGRFSPQGCEPISIAWKWVDEPKSKKPFSILIGQSQDIPYMLEVLQETLSEAHTVTGHNLLRFDLPILNGACIEWGLPTLHPIWVHDTLRHIVKFAGMSKSQENLAQTLRVGRDKFHMNDADWRRATRLTPGGKKRTRTRVEADVLQHIAMYKEMEARGLLKEPKLWKP